MADCKETQLAECLIDEYALVCCSCEQAERLRCIALARLKELTCGCMSRPIQIGSGEGAARFPSPTEAIDALIRLINMTYMVCERSAEQEGPVMETIWQDGCGKGGWVCGEHCDPAEPSWWRYHRGANCNGTNEDTPSNRC